MSRDDRAAALSGDHALMAVGLAHRSIEAFIAERERAAGSWSGHPSFPELRLATLAKVETVLGHANPAAANRRWLCEAVRAWAPLEVLFPSASRPDLRGVTGELERHLGLIVEREYGHVLAGTRSPARAGDILRGDAMRLSLEITVGAALRAVLEPAVDAADGDWLESYKCKSLAMAEYLHRHVIGLAQVLSDSAVMSYTADLSRTQRDARNACAMPQARACASGA